MIILDLYIRNFGKFRDAHFELNQDVQIFYGENEYGKSTIYAFIKAMLFGLERGRGRAAGKDEFSRYEPWEEPNYYAGMMRFLCGGRTFRLERRFDRYGKSVSLICEDDGEKLSVEDGDLDMLLGGMTAAVFENTAAIGQLTARPGQTLADELKNYAANYYETGSNAVDLQAALEYLKRRRKQTEQEIAGREEKQNRKLDKLKIAEDYVRDDLARLTHELQETGGGRQETGGDRQETGGDRQELKQEGAADKENGRTRTLAGVMIFLCGVGALAAAIWMELPWIVSAIGVILVGAGVVLTIRKAMADRKISKNRTLPETSGDDGEEQIHWTVRRIREQIEEKQIELGNIQEQIEELCEPDETRRQLEHTREALNLAMRRMAENAQEMTQQFGVRLNEETSRILAEVTDNRYTRLFVGDNLQMSVYGEGRRINVEQLSRGTVEQIWFSLRMAALELMYEEEIPVVFDDAFVYYDEKRLESTLKWLSKQKRQVIIFSCQRREREIAGYEDCVAQ